MTISSPDRVAGPFIGDGVQTGFPFALYILDDEDLVVEITDAAGVRSTVSAWTAALNSDQSGNPGGTLTLSSPLAVGSTMRISTEVASTQKTAISNGGGFYPKVIEQALDKLTILTQQVEQQVEQSLRAPDLAGLATLPDAAGRANKVLGFNAAGAPTALIPASGSATDLALTLASNSTTSQGAGALGFNFALNYVANTLGWGVRLAQLATNVLRYITPSKWASVLGNVVGVDVTAEVTAAVAAESDLYWPNGRYEINQSLTPGRGHTSTCASKNGTAIVQTDPTKAIWFVQNPQPSNANVDFTLVDGIHVGGIAGVQIGTNGGATPGVSVRIENAWLYNNTIGLHVRNGWNIEMRGSRVSSSGSACVKFETPSGGGFVNTALIEQCELNLGAAQFGVLLPAGNCNGITIRSTIIENSSHAAGFGIASPNPATDVCLGVTIDDVYMERLPGGFIALGSAAGGGANTITRCRLYAPNTANYVGIAALRGASLIDNLFDFKGATPTPVASMTDCRQGGNKIYYSGVLVTVPLVPDAANLTNVTGRHNFGEAIPVDTAQGNALRTSFMFTSYGPPAWSAIPGGTSHDFTHIVAVKRYGKSSGTQKFAVQSLPLLLSITTADNGATYSLTCAPYGTTLTKVGTGVLSIKLPTGVLDVHSEVQRHRKASFCPNITTPVVKQVFVGATAPASNDLRVLIFNAAGSAAADLATGDQIEIEVSLLQSD